MGVVLYELLQGDPDPGVTAEQMEAWRDVCGHVSFIMR